MTTKLLHAGTVVACLFALGCGSGQHRLKELDHAFLGSGGGTTAVFVSMENDGLVLHEYPWPSRNPRRVKFAEHRVWKAAYFDPIGGRIIGLHSDFATRRDVLRVFTAGGLEIDHREMNSFAIAVASRGNEVLLVEVNDRAFVVTHLNELHGEPKPVVRLPITRTDGDPPFGRIEWNGRHAVIALAGQAFVVDLKHGSVTHQAPADDICAGGRWVYLRLPGGVVERAELNDAGQFRSQSRFSSTRFDRTLLASRDGRFLMGRRLPTGKDRWTALLAGTPPLGSFVLLDTETGIESPISLSAASQMTLLTSVH
jgi:hypothetical protein